MPHITKFSIVSICFIVGATVNALLTLSACASAHNKLYVKPNFFSLQDMYTCSRQLEKSNLDYKVQALFIFLNSRLACKEEVILKNGRWAYSHNAHLAFLPTIHLFYSHGAISRLM